MGGYNSGYSSEKQRADNKEMVELELPFEGETEKAILVDEHTMCWLPKSQIEILGFAGQSVRINCPRWLAQDRKLI